MKTGLKRKVFRISLCANITGVIQKISFILYNIIHIQDNIDAFVEVMKVMNSTVTGIHLAHLILLDCYSGD